MNGYVPSVPERRKLVCRSCRARKKRCSGERPACLSCRNRNERCHYGPSSAAAHNQHSLLRASESAHWQFNPSPFFPQRTADHTLRTATNGTLIDTPFSSESSANALEPGLVSWDTLDIWPPESSDWDSNLSLPIPGLGHNMQLVTPLGPGTHTPPSSRSSGFPDEIFLPSHDKCVSLIDVYFKMVYSFLPLFHEETLRSSIAADSSRSASSRGLLFAVLALASNERRDERCRALQAQWYEEAKSQYGSTSHVPDAPIETLQTAVCIILQAMVSGDSSSMWLVLGKAWKQVVALGYHRLDQTSVPRIPGAPPLPQDWVQREAVRRIVWMLYILDRTACLPIGLDFTINENQIGVNLPMGDALFRYSTASPLGLLSIPYKPNLKRMVAAVREAAMQTNHHNTFHHVILNIMMLSNVVSHSRDKEEDPLQDEALGQLEADLFALKISLPRSTTSLTATTYSDLDNAVWVNVLLNLNIIFLNYSKNAASGQISGTHWNHCVTAARNTVGIIRQAASMSVDSLLNPYIASAIFLCGRILIIEYLVPSDATLSPRSCFSSESLASQVPTQNLGDIGDKSLWRDIEAITLVFERLEELFGAIGKKFKNGMLYYLAQDTRTLSRIKNSGVKDLLAQCSSWEAAALAASKKNTVECQSWVN